MSSELAVLEVPLRAPISGPDGRVNPVWARWFLRVYAATGGNIGTTMPTESLLFDPPVTSPSDINYSSYGDFSPVFENEEKIQDISPAAVEAQIPQEFAPVIQFDQAQEMQTRIEVLESYIAVLETRLSNLESGTLL